MNSTDKWIVEAWKNMSYKWRRVFKTREEAIAFINNKQDDGFEAPAWDFQIIHGRTVEQTGINGNNR